MQLPFPPEGKSGSGQFNFTEKIFIYLSARGLSGGMCDPVLWGGIEPGAPELAVLSLSHWTTREVPPVSLDLTWRFPNFCWMEAVWGGGWIGKVGPDHEGHVQGFRSMFFTRIIYDTLKLPTSAGSWKKSESSKKTSISAFLTMLKPLTVWITINCGKFWKRWEYQTSWPASWEICMQVRKQQLELDMEQQTGSK